MAAFEASPPEKRHEARGDDAAARQVARGGVEAIGGASPAVAAAAAAKGAVAKTTTAGALHTPVALVAVPLIGPPLAYRRIRAHRRAFRSWEKDGERAEWARWKEAGLLTRVSEEEVQRRVDDKYAELARAYYLEWAKFAAPKRRRAQGGGTHTYAAPADAKARAKLAKFLKLPDVGGTRELLDIDWRDTT